MHGLIQLAISLNLLGCQERGGIPGAVHLSLHRAVEIVSWLTGGNYLCHPDIGCDGLRSTPRTSRGPVPEHVANLYHCYCDGYGANLERRQTVKLLQDVYDVFSDGDDVIGTTKVVCHEITLATGTISNWQPNDWVWRKTRCWAINYKTLLTVAWLSLPQCVELTSCHDPKERCELKNFVWTTANLTGRLLLFLDGWVSRWCLQKKYFSSLALINKYSSVLIPRTRQHWSHAVGLENWKCSDAGWPPP